MANRILRDWTTSERIDKLSLQAEVFFTRLIMKADDHGCFHANVKLLKAALFPLKDIGFDSIERWLNECDEVGIIQIYKADGRDYLKIAEFGQRLRNMQSKFPQPVDKSPTNDSNKPPETKRNEVETESETKQEREAEMLSHLGLEISVKKLLDDELWRHNIHTLARGKDLEGAARASFVFLTTKPERFKTADLNELKKVTLSWLENKPQNGINGHPKVDQKERMKNL